MRNISLKDWSRNKSDVKKGWDKSKVKRNRTKKHLWVVLMLELVLACVLICAQLVSNQCYSTLTH